MKKLLLLISLLISLKASAQIPGINDTVRITPTAPTFTPNFIQNIFTSGGVNYRILYLRNPVTNTYDEVVYSKYLRAFYVPATRQIINGYGVLGGGTLATDRTLNADTAGVHALVSKDRLLNNFTGYLKKTDTGTTALPSIYSLSHLNWNWYGNSNYIGTSSFSGNVFFNTDASFSGGHYLQFNNGSHTWELSTQSDGTFNMWQHGTGTAAFNFLTTNNGEITDNLGNYFTKTNGTTNITLKRDQLIVSLGDSFTANGNYIHGLDSLLTAGKYTFLNLGNSGGRVTNMTARFIEVTNSGALSYIQQGGINDIIADVSAATIEAAFQANYTSAHNIGIKVVALNIPPFGANVNWTSGREAVRVAVNTWIASTAINIDYKIDIATALWDPSNHVNLNPVYDSGDGLHPTTAGYIAGISTPIYNGAVFTLQTNIPVISISKSVSIDQDLTTYSTSSLKTLTTVNQIITGTNTSSTPALTVNTGSTTNPAIIGQQAYSTSTGDVLQIKDAVGDTVVSASQSGVTLRPVGASDVGLTVKLPSGYSGNVMQILTNLGVSIFRVNSVGNVVTPGAGNVTSFNNSQILFNDAGLVLSRNVADANPALVIQNANTGSTGAVVQYKFGTKVIGSLGYQGLAIGLSTPVAGLTVARSNAGFGTITTTATLTTVTGVGTDFLNWFKIGDTITGNGETRTISAIASATSMTTDAWTNTNTAIAYTNTSTTAFTVNNNGNVFLSQLGVNKGIVFTTSTTGQMSQTATGAANTLLHGNGSSNPTFSAVATADIAAAAVTYAKIQSSSGANKILGTASGTTWQEIGLGIGLAYSSTNIVVDTATAATHTYTARYATINGSPTFVTQTSSDNSTKAATTAFVKSVVSLHGNSTTTGTATTVVTVTIGSTLANNTYAVAITPRDLLTAVNYYISAKTTTTFDVTFVTALTGSINFDYIIAQ